MLNQSCKFIFLVVFCSPQTCSPSALVLGAGEAAPRSLRRLARARPGQIWQTACQRLGRSICARLLGVRLLQRSTVPRSPTLALQRCTLLLLCSDIPAPCSPLRPIARTLCHSARQHARSVGLVPLSATLSLPPPVAGASLLIRVPLGSAPIDRAPGLDLFRSALGCSVLGCPSTQLRWSSS